VLASAERCAELHAALDLLAALPPRP